MQNYGENSCFSLWVNLRFVTGTDKVRMYEEEIMTNDDNLESNLLTSNLLKMTSGTS